MMKSSISSHLGFIRYRVRLTDGQTELQQVAYYELTITYCRAY